MARVTLAYHYPRRQHEGDERSVAGAAVDLPDDVATGLVRDGLARWADDESPGPETGPEPEEG